jgi:hypothetical protein
MIRVTKSRSDGEGMLAGEKDMHIEFLWGGRNLKEIDDLKNLVINGSIILKCFPN